MDRETRVILGVIGTVLAIGVRLAAAASRSSRSTYSSYSSSLHSPYSPYSTSSARAEERLRSLREDFRETREEREARKELEAAQKAIDALFTDHCDTVLPDRLMLEVQAVQPDVNALHAALMEELTPEGKSWPKPVKLAGLEVRVMERRLIEGKDHPSCLDNTTGLAQGVRQSLRLADVTSLTRVNGAAVVKTTDSTAAQLLLANDLKEVLQPKGPLVAFVGTDNFVAFADSANTEAVKAAAQASAQGIDTTAEQGCVRADALVFLNGAWTKWTPNPVVRSDVEAHRRAAQACLDTMMQDSLSSYTETWGGLKEGLKGLDKPATRRFDLTTGSIARVSLDRYDGPQLVARADQVELAHSDGRKTVVSWPVFQRATQKALTKVTLDGHTWDGAWIVDPEMVASLDRATNATLKALK